MKVKEHHIQNLIQEGEHQMLDFKFEISDSRRIARSLAAFANTDGGRLLVGVKDNGAIAGVRSDEEIHMIQAAAEMYCQPKVEYSTEEWEINGKTPQIEWAEEHNIENYLQFSEERKMDVVIIIGIGGTAEKPEEVYAAPLHALKKFTYARKKYLELFRLTDPNGYYRFILSQHTVVN